MLMAGAHVDDIMWASQPEYEYVLTEKVFKHFELNGIVEKEFRFCGRDYVQDDDYNVTITCKHNTEKILPISYDRGKRGIEDKATAGEIGQLRSVVGSLAWISRQTRPDLCYQCSRLQSIITVAKVKHLVQANKVLHTKPRLPQI